MYDLLLENTWQLDWHHWEGTGVGAFLNWSSAPIALHRGSPRQRLTSEFANLAHRGTYCAQSMAFWVMNSNRISSHFQSQPASMVSCVPTWWLTWPGTGKSHSDMPGEPPRVTALPAHHSPAADPESPCLLRCMLPSPHGASAAC